MFKTIEHCREDRMAEWSKALVLGTSHICGVGSNPTPVIFCNLIKVTLL